MVIKFKTKKLVLWVKQSTYEFNNKCTHKMYIQFIYVLWIYGHVHECYLYLEMVKFHSVKQLTAEI